MRKITQDEVKFKENIDWNKVRLLLKTGVLGAVIILIGDLFMGWGIKDMSLTGIENRFHSILRFRW